MNLHSHPEAFPRAGTVRRERVRLAERHDRLSPFSAGALAGGFGGAAMLFVSDVIQQKLGLANASTMAVGWLRVHSMSTAPWIPFVAAALGGAFVGGAFAIVTRHLRRTLPLLVWALIFFPSVWMLFLAFARPLIGAGNIPFASTLIGSAAFAVCATIQLPLRARKALSMEGAHS